MKILFLCLSTLKFDTKTPFSEPLGGTESALAYLAPEMVKLGHDVTLMCGTHPHVGEDGVKHCPVSEDLSSIGPDVIVVTSAPQAAPGIRKAAPNTKIVLWNHMRPDQPAMRHIVDPVCAAAIDNIVYVSEIQRQAFVDLPQRGTLDLNGAHTTVINNAIAPCFENMFSSADEIFKAKKCRGVYTSTPYRGLAVLAQIKEIPIDVYSSMAVYQGNDAVFATMYENLKKNDCLTLYGSVSQKKLMKHIRETAFLVYPSVFAECHSIAIIEAMAAGLKVITTDMASPQTDFIDSMSATKGSVDDYARMLRRNINSFRSRPEEWAEKMWKQVQYVNSEFTWKKKAKEWDVYLSSVCEKTLAA